MLCYGQLDSTIILEISTLNRRVTQATKDQYMDLKYSTLSNPQRCNAILYMYKNICKYTNIYIYIVSIYHICHIYSIIAGFKLTMCES